MKRDKNYILRHVAGSDVIVPVGAAAVSFPGMLTVNSTGILLWELLEGEQSVESLTKALCDQFEVEPAQASEDVEKFLSCLRRAGALEAES